MLGQAIRKTQWLDKPVAAAIVIEVVNCCNPI